jgi:hypothetical protein
VTFLFVLLGSIVVLVVVTRIAGKRDAARKAALSERDARRGPDDGVT